MRPVELVATWRRKSCNKTMLMISCDGLLSQFRKELTWRSSAVGYLIHDDGGALEKSRKLR